MESSKKCNTFLVLIGILSTNFIFAVVVPSTPQHQRTQNHVYSSETKIAQEAPNYCKRLIATLNDSTLKDQNKATKIKNLFSEYFSQIPYIFETFYQDEESLRYFYLSLFLIISKSLMCNTDESEAYCYYFDDLDDKLVVIWLPISVASKTYIMQFQVSEKECSTSFDPVNKYVCQNNECEEIVVYAVHLFMHGNGGYHKVEVCKISNCGEREECFTTQKLEYKEDNFIKRMIFFPHRQPSLKETNFNGLKIYLEAIFKVIPNNWCVEYEKFYQAIFYGIVLFFGNAKCIPEALTNMGRADVVLETSRYIWIVEFKINRRAKEALKQIERNEYAKFYVCSPKKKIMVGVNVCTKKLYKEGISVSVASKEYEPAVISPAKDFSAKRQAVEGPQGNSSKRRRK